MLYSNTAKPHNERMVGCKLYGLKCNTMVVPRGFKMSMWMGVFDRWLMKGVVSRLCFEWCVLVEGVIAARRRWGAFVLWARHDPWSVLYR